MVYKCDQVNETATEKVGMDEKPNLVLVGILSWKSDAHIFGRIASFALKGNWPYYSQLKSNCC